MAEQMGNMWMPTFPEVTGDTRRMNSNHAVATIADALTKGLKVDAAKAYEACQKGIEEKTLAPWSGAAAGWLDNFYRENGYIPALRPGEKENDPNVHPFEKRQPVAVTLGTSYDQWCLSRIAETLGKKMKLRTIYNALTITGIFLMKQPVSFTRKIRKVTGLNHSITVTPVVWEPVNIMEKTTVGFIVGMYPITWLI